MCYDVTPSVLSAGDIMGIQKRYGRKPSGSLVGLHGHCANISGGSTVDGAAVGAWPCTGSWNDSFFPPSRFSPNDRLEHLQTLLNTRCLRVSGTTAPNLVVSWTCADIAPQRFVFGNATSVGAELRAIGNLCVRISGGRPQVAVCDGSNSQRWDMIHGIGTQRGDQIRWVGGTNQCLSSTTAAGALGERLTVATCSATDTKQRFTYPGKGVILLANTNYCLNVSGGLPTPGSEIGLWTGCKDAVPPQNEQFFLRGRVRALNHCMQYRNSAAPGDRTEVKACDANNAGQIWDYYL
jgi:hypothetical protein